LNSLQVGPTRIEDRAHAAALGLHREHARERLEPGLRGVVGALERARAQRGVGADEDHVADTARDHARHDTAGHVHRAEQVHLDVEAQLVDRGLVDPRRHVLAGVVHEQIDRLRALPRSALTNASIESGRVTSRTCANARPPSASTCFATASSRSARRAPSATFQPWRPQLDGGRGADSEEAPVTIAVRGDDTAPARYAIYIADAM
jgi:hypothetical protein